MTDKKSAIDAVAADVKRTQLLAQHGLEECMACRSWIYLRPRARSFHFRRCTG